MKHSIPILPTISTSFIILSAIFMAIGLYFIKKRQVDKHKKFMTLSAVSALCFFIIYMSRTVFIGNTSFGGPDSLKMYYVIFLIFHIVFATIGGIFGIITLYLGYKNKIRKHRKIAPLTSIIWFITAITGIVVYLLLYVFYQGGEITSPIKAILGF